MASITEKARKLIWPTVAVVLLAGGTAARAEAVRDALGREVEISLPARRIVSLAPNLTEILFALGLEKEVAGVTVFCDWPPGAKKKPKVGGFVNPSLEAVVALVPDLVLATADGNRETDVMKLQEVGVPVYVADSRTFDDIIASVRALGFLGGKEKEASSLAAMLAERRDRVAAAVAHRPAVTVWVALDRSPLISAGKGTFIDDLVSLAGGANIVDSPRVKYPVMNPEELMVRNPQVIVVAAMAGGTGSAGASWTWIPEAERLQAVRDGRVHEVLRGDFFRPGPRIWEALEELAAMFHPEAFR